MLVFAACLFVGDVLLALALYREWRRRQRCERSHAHLLDKIRTRIGAPRK